LKSGNLLKKKKFKSFLCKVFAIKIARHNDITYSSGGKLSSGFVA